VNCPNCGAAMRFIDGRDYFVCRYCATHTFPKGAAATGDGVDLFDRDAELPCPLCAQTLAFGTVCGREVRCCRSCRGFLASNETFAAVVRERRRSRDGPAADPTPINPDDLHRALRCPQCRGRMETHPYYGPGAVVVDTCAVCALIWLDAGELSVIARAPGRIA